MALKAFIFDLDGTVIQSQNVLKMSLQQYFTQEQCRVLMEHYPYLKGLNEEQAAHAIKDILAIAHISIDQLRRDLIALCIENKNRTGIAYVHGFEQFYKHYATYDIVHCIATNGRGASLAATLKIIDLPCIFGDKIYTPEHVGGKTKPDPAIFLYALDQLGCKKEEAIIFEDSHPGVAAAHAAGIACIGINTAGSLDQDKDNLLLCVENYNDLTMDLIVKKFLEHCSG